jgi:hypothetical protein
MAFTTYATVGDFKGWVKLTDNIDDTVISFILESVTEWIDEYTDRHFWRDGTVGAEVARTFEACNWYQLDIDDLVPGSVTAFKTDEDGDGVFETTWAAGDYQLLPVNRPTGRPYTKVQAVGNRLLPVPYVPPGRADRVQITGIWGWPEVPRPVRQACLEQTNREFKRSVSPEGIAGFVDLGVMRLSGRLDPDLRNLAPYRRTPLLVA